MLDNRTSAAFNATTLGLLAMLCAAAGRLEPGDLVAAAVFGSGLTWASMLVRW